MDLLPQFASAVEEENLVNKGDRVLVAVSGGPDSVALLHLFCRLAARWQLSVHCAHVNHMLRPEAGAEAGLVAELARRLGVQAHIGRLDVPAYRKQHRLSTQVAARQMRYTYLVQTAGQIGAHRIALAHHADDQAETLLLHLLWGAGAGGLAAMLPVRQELYIRPLLGMRKQQLVDYCHFFELPYAVDSSNFKTVYQRNKIRLELIPLLQKQYNSSIVEVLARTAAILAAEDQYLQDTAQKALREITCRQPAGEDRLCLELAGFAHLPLALQRRVLRLAWRQMVSGQELAFVQVEKARRLALAKTPGGRLDWPAGVVLTKRYGRLEIFKDREKVSAGASRRGDAVSEQTPGHSSDGGKDPAEPFGREFLLPVPGEVNLPGPAGVITARLLPAREVVTPDAYSGNQAVLDAGTICGGLRVRWRRPGDLFSPLGLAGTMKLKKFFIDRRVPREERDNIPLVVDEKGIVWVAGYVPAHRCRVTEQSEMVVHLRYLK
ncbi:tRNA lysidine(34) synthetase TilS [Desulfurispora thermophila]|uniref:tRNA lysidine(34) synthetase TilS n=1 Tax=Desulfurispora thermophila TaxID=265470 RepID=UPI0014613AF6|nr:tRNA lysidine(34) synthetase TilS [Desulfurispora thermophila]